MNQLEIASIVGAITLGNARRDAYEVYSDLLGKGIPPGRSMIRKDMIFRCVLGAMLGASSALGGIVGKAVSSGKFGYQRAFVPYFVGFCFNNRGLSEGQRDTLVLIANVWDQYMASIYIGEDSRLKSSIWSRIEREKNLFNIESVIRTLGYVSLQMLSDGVMDGLVDVSVKDPLFGAAFGAVSGAIEIRKLINRSIYIFE